MNLHLPIEVFNVLMIFVLSMIWKGYHSMWKHIVRVEKRVLMIMVMLRDRGFQIPNDSDTEVFARSNNLDAF